MTTIQAKEPSSLQPIFARHETFHPRFGWLKKGFDQTKKNPGVFFDDSALVALGVGKNMVKAIRYWCLAYKIVAVDETKKRGGLAPTAFGKHLLDNDGWDPYLEDLGSLWLLHWSLLKAPIEATSWFYVFNVYNGNVFKAEELLQGLIEYRDRMFPQSRIIDSSLSKDINCLLKMYVEPRSSDGPREDSIDSPFIELGLIKSYEESKSFIMNIGQKPGLAPAIIVAACLDFISCLGGGAKTVSINRLLHDEGSPGRCLKIKESTLIDAIEAISEEFNELAISDAAGITQLAFSGKPEVLMYKILNRYYRKRG